MSSRSWILTFVANGKAPTFQQFADKFPDIDECHSTRDSAVTYIYVHFKSATCLSRMNTLLTEMKNEIGLVPFEVFGYDSVTSQGSDSPLTEHVGFKILFEHYQTKNPTFQSCTDGRPGISRGLFWKLDSVSRIKHALSKRNKALVEYFEGMERECVASKQKDKTIEHMQTQINGLLAAVKELQRYEFALHVIRFRLKTTDRYTRGVLLAPDHRGRPLMPDFFVFDDASSNVDTAAVGVPRC